jgi:hypothetical protein
MAADAHFGVRLLAAALRLQVVSVLDKRGAAGQPQYM